MKKHESYATRVLEATLGDRFSTNDLIFSFGPEAGTGRIDGIIDGKVAVEFGVGSPKQTRASVLDLIFHPLPKKLLIVVDTPGHAADRTVFQAATILGRAGCSGVVYRLPGEEAGGGLVRGDLVEAVNKYIGETEKNLVRVLDPMESVDRILSFGEDDRVVDDLSSGAAMLRERVRVSREAARAMFNLRDQPELRVRVQREAQRFDQTGEPLSEEVERLIDEYKDRL